MAQFKVGEQVKIKESNELCVVQAYPDEADIIDGLKDHVLVLETISLIKKKWRPLCELEPMKPTKTADEMLAELGFKKNIPYYNEDSIHYSIENYEENGWSLMLIFSNNSYSVSHYYPDGKGKQRVFRIPKDLHKAITKKLEELGWL